MSALEGELEILLGELNIKMKGGGADSSEPLSGHRRCRIFIKLLSQTCFYFQVWSASLGSAPETNTRSSLNPKTKI